MLTQKSVQFAYRRSPDQNGQPVRRPVAVIGGGPVGLSLALDLAGRGIPVVLLDESDRIGEGSRAICFAKRTLEIFDRLGVGEALVAKGVSWKTGRVFNRDRELYAFDLLPEAGHKMPAFINIQQYHVEAALAERAGRSALIDLRWRNRVVDVAPRMDGARLAIETPDGPYDLECDWVVACDGSRSPTRAMLGLDFAGEVFDDRFLIADIKMTADFPTERWFWFAPPFHDGRSALLHKQPEGVWRIDLQLGADADVERERQPDVVRSRIKRMLGHSNFELEWVSIYTFQCRRMDRFVHGRVVFAGDAAHQVSPFGARGANSGIQDAENLAWKLALVVRGEAPEQLVETYGLERSAAADENILNSTRATDFISPPSAGELVLREAALGLAAHAPFAKRMINSGRLSTPSTYDTSLSTPDDTSWSGVARLGAPLPDAPIIRSDGEPGFLSEAIGRGFIVLVIGNDADIPALDHAEVLVIGRDARDVQGVLAERLDASPGSTYLVRPDGHLAARWRRFDATKIAQATLKAKGF